MYRYTSKQLKIKMDEFLPFEGKLDENNRWVKLAEIIPWESFEEEYAKNFKKSKTGEVAHNVRIALGSLIIKERLGLTDEETVNQITENPYLQWFLGFAKYKNKAPFNPSQMTHFRKRFPVELLNKFNEAIIASTDKDDNNDNKGTPTKNVDKPDEKIKSEEKNSGTLMLDATCVPADIQYPTDVRLLNDAREMLEDIVDILHKSNKGTKKRPRTYRMKARKEYMDFTKKRKPKAQLVRKTKGKLLRYIRRLLDYTEKLALKNGLKTLPKRKYKNLLVISELYRQQVLMQKTKQCRVDNRIVSINQPHVRPIVRGKASASTEFGAKVEISLDEGFARCEVISWDAFNEANTLKEAVERYRQRKGVYPAVILVDKIYRNMENREFCKSKNIRLSGPALGRKTEKLKRYEKKQTYQDSCDRNQVEGKFGEAKRKYSLGKIMTKLAETSSTTILLGFIVINLEKKLRLLCANFYLSFSIGNLLEFLEFFAMKIDMRASLSNP